MPTVMGSPLILASCVFIIMTACIVQFVGPVFVITFLTFAVGVRFRGYHQVNVRLELA